MKRLWASVVIFVALVTVCALGYSNTETVTSKMIETVTAAKTARINGDSTAAVKLSHQAESDWKNYHPLLCTYMPHSRLEAIDQTLAELPMLCLYGEGEQFLSECDRGLTQLSYLTETEIPNLANIF